MDPDKVLATVSPALRVSLENQLIQINRNYMAALARLYHVDIRTVYIWHITGRV